MFHTHVRYFLLVQQQEDGYPDTDDQLLQTLSPDHPRPETL